MEPTGTAVLGNAERRSERAANMGDASPILAVFLRGGGGGR